MEWIERFNCAVQYIEEHLTEEIDYEKTAHIACCSSYHFQRMFSYLADVPLSEYIRRRRMSLAAADLMNSEDKIVDIALKYGYDSPTAFNRAFQNVHGAAPSVIRAGGVSVKAFPPISFKITIKGAVEMEYRIEKKNNFRIVGVSQPLQNNIEENFRSVPLFWQKVSMDNTVEKLSVLMEGEPFGLLGVSACNEQDCWKYYIAVASSKPVDEPLEEYIIPAMTWAIFAGEGIMPVAMQELEKRIVTDWLPTSGYEYANAPDIEVYLNADPQNAKFEVWIPVIKKE